MVIFDFLKNLQKIYATIEDENWNAIIGSMYPEQSASFTSSVEVNSTPDTAKAGVRSITANTTSQDPLERILAYSIEVLSLSLRLQRSGQDGVRIKRLQLIRYIRTINNNILELVDWHDENEEDESKTADYKISVKEAYRNCMKAIENFNLYIVRVNSGESDIIWEQPDSPDRDIPSITQLPTK